MAFRKRNIAIQRAVPITPRDDSTGNRSVQEVLPGIRPSPLTGHPVTSTGILSLDNSLGGHGGLAMGCSVLIEESGTTDFSGTLLKFFAAEGIAQGHQIHVVGVGQQWTRELPGLEGSVDGLSQDSRSSASSSDEKMKIAWRYERLGQHDASRAGGVVSSRGRILHPSSTTGQQLPTFCHTFDLAKRLAIVPTTPINHIPVSAMTPSSQSPFTAVVRDIIGRIASTPSQQVHRIVIPSLLSPAHYPPHAASPEHFLQFLHSIRAIQRRYPERTSVMATVPTELYPRSSGLMRWAEHLCDGVIELQPFPHMLSALSSLNESGGARTGEDQPQGMFKLHKLPALTERGAGSSGAVGVGDDLAFTLSRRKFTIRPFSLPPMEQDEGDKGPAAVADGNGSGMNSIKQSDIEF